MGSFKNQETRVTSLRIFVSSEVIDGDFGVQVVTELTGLSNNLPSVSFSFVLHALVSYCPTF